MTVVLVKERSIMKNSKTFNLFTVQAGKEWLKVSDPSERANNGAGGTPVTVSPVLPSLHEVLSAPEVWVLIKDPVAVHHVTGVDMAVVEAVRHTGAVVHELHHVTAEVGLLIDAHPVGSPVLLAYDRTAITGIVQMITYTTITPSVSQ